MFSGSFPSLLSPWVQYDNTADKKAITSNDVTRLQLLEGEKGSVACRVHGRLIAQPIPRLSRAHTFEFSGRSFLRMINLVAVRGAPGEGMIGPGDYYGNWYNANNHSFSISIKDGFPTIYQHKLHVHRHEPRKEITNNDTTEVRMHWVSGKNTTEIQKKKKEYQAPNKPATGDSLFKNAGILEVYEVDNIHLKKLSAKGLDLTSFKARLVDNHLPFSITKEHIDSRDIWRAVSYQFDPNYAKRQIEQGGGLFLETHNFAQSMTPLDQSAGGYVMLGKWKHSQIDIMEIIAVKIPFGSTLIIEQGCIHGDTTLNGMYMMCMTSSHVTMSSADTVFLKQASTKKNISVTVDEDEKQDDESVLQSQSMAPKPLVMYNGFADTAFNQETKEMSFIFAPFSMIWWKNLSNDVQLCMSYVASGFGYFPSTETVKIEDFVIKQLEAESKRLSGNPGDTFFSKNSLAKKMQIDHAINEVKLFFNGEFNKELLVSILNKYANDKTIGEERNFLGAIFRTILGSLGALLPGLTLLNSASYKNYFFKPKSQSVLLNMRDEILENRFSI